MTALNSLVFVLVSCNSDYISVTSIGHSAKSHVILSGQKIG
jgi:hypothetical protein